MPGILVAKSTVCALVRYRVLFPTLQACVFSYADHFWLRCGVSFTERFLGRVSTIYIISMHALLLNIVTVGNSHPVLTLRLDRHGLWTLFLASFLIPYSDHAIDDTRSLRRGVQ